jgi:hypothetical protein
MFRGHSKLTVEQQLKKEKERALKAMQFLSSPSYSAVGLGVSHACMKSLHADGLVSVVPGSGPFLSYSLTDAGRRA